MKKSSILFAVSSLGKHRFEHMRAIKCKMSLRDVIKLMDSMYITPEVKIASYLTEVTAFIDFCISQPC